MTKKKIHILVVIRWPVGGIRTFCKYVYTNFDRSRFKFTILAPEIEELRTLVKDLNGYDIKIIPFSNQMSYFNLIKIFSAIFFRSFDIIHSHGLTAGLCCALPARLSGKPHLMTSHDVFTADQMRGMRGLATKMVCSILLPMIDKIHHVSNDARENMLQYVSFLNQFSMNKHITIPNSINVDQYLQAGVRNFYKEMNLPKDLFLIGFMGRFMAQKGFVNLINAVELLIQNKRAPKKFLVLCFGWGGFIREEQQLIQRRGLSQYFKFLPFTSNVASSLKGLDVLAIPSKWEAFGLIAAEALVAGLPVIGTNCIGLREVLKGSPAKIVPVDDPEALSSGFLKEMEQPTKIEAKNYISVATKRFNGAHQVKKLKEQIIELVKV